MEKVVEESFSNIVTHNFDVFAQSLLIWSIVEDMYRILVLRVQSVLLIEFLLIYEAFKPEGREGHFLLDRLENAKVNQGYDFN